MFVRMLSSVPARGRELAGFVMRLASPRSAPLPLDLRLMPFKLLFAHGKLAAQMPLYPGGEPFGIEMGLLAAHLDERGRPTVGGPVQARTGGSSAWTFKLTSGITGRRAVFRARGRTIPNNNIAYAQARKYRGGKQ